ncbi:MAG: hypothetical protein R2939_10940 [Kofleriaceae bacterium]
MNARRLGMLGIAFAAACGGATTGPTPPPIGPVPAAATTAALVGPLCGGAECQCRDPGAPDEGGAGLAPEGHKRYEVRVGPSEHPLWVTLDGGVMYKSAERATACFYVDLAPGEHALRLRASNPSGVQAVVRVAEYGVATGSWYRTFEFACGEGGVCTSDGLDAQRARYQATHGGKHDPCGSTLVRGLTWDTSKMAPTEPASEVQVDLTLAAYAFVPDKPHGDDGCRK